MAVQELTAYGPPVAENALAPADLLASASRYAAEGTAWNTRRAYRADWSAFEHWCAAAGAQALPTRPEVLALYLAHLAEAGRKASTIERCLAAIAQANKAAGFASPRGAAPHRCAR